MNDVTVGLVRSLKSSRFGFWPCVRGRVQAGIVPESRNEVSG